MRSSNVLFKDSILASSSNALLRLKSQRILSRPNRDPAVFLARSLSLILVKVRSKAFSTLRTSRNSRLLQLACRGSMASCTCTMALVLNETLRAIVLISLRACTSCSLVSYKILATLVPNSAKANMAATTSSPNILKRCGFFEKASTTNSLCSLQEGKDQLEKRGSGYVESTSLSHLARQPLLCRWSWVSTPPPVLAYTGISSPTTSF